MTRGSRGGGGRGGEGGGGGSAQRDPTSIVREAVGGNVGDDDIAAALSETGGDVNEAVARLVDSEWNVFVLSLDGTGQNGEADNGKWGGIETPCDGCDRCVPLCFDAPALTLFFFLSFSLYKTNAKKQTRSRRLPRRKRRSSPPARA